MDGEVLRVAKDCISTSRQSTPLSHRSASSRARLPPSEPESSIELTEMKTSSNQMSLEGSLVTSSIPVEAPIPSCDSIRSLPGLENESVSVEKKPREKRNMINAVIMDYVFCVSTVMIIVRCRVIWIASIHKS